MLSENIWFTSNHSMFEEGKSDDVQTDRQTNRIPSCRLDPFYRRGRVKMQLLNCKRYRPTTLHHNANSRPYSTSFVNWKPTLSHQHCQYCHKMKQWSLQKFRPCKIFSPNFAHISKGDPIHQARSYVLIKLFRRSYFMALCITWFSIGQDPASMDHETDSGSVLFFATCSDC